MSDTNAAATDASPPAGGRRPLERLFHLSERGTTVPREIRGGLATFFAMAYIIVLNPIILGSAKDMYGHQLDNAQLVTATALTAAFTTLLMGVIGNVPIALAAGLGVNAVVALQLAPRMTWPDAMGMVVLAGLVIDAPGRHRAARAGHERRSRSALQARASPSASACSSR